MAEGAQPFLQVVRRFPVSRTAARRHRSRGVAAIEAALILPIMIFFIFATVELYQYFRVVAILDRTAFSIADGIAMQPALYDGGPCDVTDHLCTYAVIAADLMRPVDYQNDGHMTVRLYVAHQADGDESGSTTATWRNELGWSKACDGAGVCVDTSAASAPIDMPPSPMPGDTMLVVTITQTYEPFIIGARFWSVLGGDRTMSSTVFYRPRFSDLKELS